MTSNRLYQKQNFYVPKIETAERLDKIILFMINKSPYVAMLANFFLNFREFQMVYK